MHKKYTAMNTEKFFAAIDLGSSKITGVVAQKTAEGKLDIIACEQVESKFIRRGEIKNASDTAFQINDIIKKLENNRVLREAKAEIKKVYVGLGGHTLKTVNNTVKRVLGSDEEVTAELVDNMREENFKIKIDNNEIYEIIEQEYIVDDEFEYNPVGMTCFNLQGRYKIICGKPELRKSLQRSFEKANLLEIAGLYISPIATSESVISESEKEMGCALIDFGADTTSVCVFFNGYLRHLAVIPFGGTVVTNDIKDLNLTQSVSEKLKIQFGNAMAEMETDPKNIVIAAESAGHESKTISTSYLASIIEARMDEILDIVWGEIEKSKFAGKLGSGIIITGGASKLNNLDELIKLKTGCDVRYANDNKYLSDDLNPKYREMINSHLIGLLLLADETCVKTKEEVAETTTVKRENKKEKKEKIEGPGLFSNWTKKVGNKLESLFDVDTNM